LAMVAVLKLPPTLCRLGDGGSFETATDLMPT